MGEEFYYQRKPEKATAYGNEWLNPNISAREGALGTQIPTVLNVTQHGDPKVCLESWAWRWLLYSLRNPLPLGQESEPSLLNLVSRWSTGLLALPEAQPGSCQLLLTTLFKHLNNSIRHDPGKTCKWAMDGEGEC